MPAPMVSHRHSRPGSGPDWSRWRYQYLLYFGSAHLGSDQYQANVMNCLISCSCTELGMNAFPLFKLCDVRMSPPGLIAVQHRTQISAALASSQGDGTAVSGVSMQNLHIAVSREQHCSDTCHKVWKHMSSQDVSEGSSLPDSNL